MSDGATHPTSPARRIEESQRVVGRLAAEVFAWFDRWQASPTGPYHKTQLAVLRASLEGHIGKLTAHAKTLPGSQVNTGEAYREARAVESVAAWVRKFWEYYRSRFDQRLDGPAVANGAPPRPLLGDVLAAADEVLWSCHSAVSKPGMPTPLAFIDDQARTTAVFESGPAASRLAAPKSAQGLLGAFINTLPIPLVGLSPVVADAPWWLAVIGHEIGHHVHDGYKCLDTFRAYLETVAAAVSPAAGQRWGPWASEVFADWCSAAAAGQWAAVALAEQVWGTDGDLIAASDQYPPSVVRIELITRLAAAYGLPTDSIPAGHRWAVIGERVRTDLRAGSTATAIVEDLQVVDALAAAVDQKNEFDRLLAVRNQWVPDLSPASGTDPLVPRSEFLLQTRADVQPPVDKSLKQRPAARIIVAAAVRAWQRAPSFEARNELASRVVLVLRHAVAPGERGGHAPAAVSVELETAGAKQVDELLSYYRAGGHRE